MYIVKTRAKQCKNKYYHFSSTSEPGKGMRCGPMTCNRYADCHATITVQTNITSLNCRCLPGFKGGGIGINSCVPITLEGNCFLYSSTFSIRLVI